MLYFKQDKLKTSKTLAFGVSGVRFVVSVSPAVINL